MLNKRRPKMNFERLESRHLLAADLVINEFMAANQDTLRDDYRQYSDWIELWNRSDELIQLEDFHLTDDPDNLNKWSFPAGATMNAGQYLVVFASGLDTVDADGAFHTNFQLDASGDYLALVDASSLAIASEFTSNGEDYPEQFGDVSFGNQGPPDGLVARDLPQAIDATEPNRVVSQIDVRGLVGAVEDVNVQINVLHSRVSDLTVSLISPAGTRLQLASAVGGDGANFSETGFDDESPFAIDLFGSAPFTGQFQPQNALSTFDGESAIGTWQLEIDDKAMAEGGSLQAWSLEIETSGGGEPASEGLIGYLAEPTPGNPNHPEVTNVGPIISSVTNRPMSWSENEDLVITAELTSRHDVIADVLMAWRIDYLDESIVSMRDDGQQADATAGDGLYTASIPASSFTAGQMVRWAVSATDVAGRGSRSPAFLDQDGTGQSAQYFGTVITDPSIDSQLSVFQWFVEPGQERRADSRRGTRTSVFYLDQFYDNAYVRLRGGSSANLVKKSYKFDFNTNDLFRFDDAAGRVSEINVNTTYSNKDYVRQALAFETYSEAGVMASVAFPLRIQRNSEFFSVAMFVEQPDGDLLEREGRDSDGALYKMFNTFNSANGAEKKTRQYERNDDLSEFVSEVNGRSGEDLRNYLFDNVNLPAVLNYLAATSIMQNNDQMAKNYLLYRDTNGTGEWEFLPWDLDLTFGLHFMSNDSILDDSIWADKDAFTTFAGVTIWPSHPFVGDEAHPANRSWNRLIDALYQVPEIREMYLRRLRSLMDDLLQPPETPVAERRFEARLDEYFAQIQSDVQLDYEKWASPWKWGNDETLSQSMQRVKDEFLAVRRQHLYVTHGIDNVANGDDLAGIPHAQAADVSVHLGELVETSPASGNALDRFFTIENPNDVAVDLSGWRINGAVQHTLTKGTTIPSNGRLYLSPDVRAFRTRANGPSGNQGNLVQDLSQNLPSSGILTLTDASGRTLSTVSYQSDTDASPQQQLRISEINFNPYPAMPQFGEADVDNDSFEFVELLNAGEDVVELAGVKFVEMVIENDRQGITFEFAGGRLLPGERTVVVKSRLGFASRYGSEIVTAGEFVGKLSNGGELLTLVDRNNEPIDQVNYNDRGAWPGGLTDGDGATLERIDETADSNEPQNWRASQSFGGSPATASSAVTEDVVINELLSASTPPQVDQVELMNTSNRAIDISGWYVSDSANIFKYQIPIGTPPLEPQAYFVLSETTLGFGFRGDDDDDARLVASNAAGRPIRFADYVEFAASQPGVSIGRWPNGTGEFASMPALSIGSPNQAPMIAGDLNGDQVLSADDVDYFCGQLNSPEPDAVADVDKNGSVDVDDLLLLLPALGAVVGDANFDGIFNSGDLVTAFQAGTYEGASEVNATWSTGDWNCDGEFNSADLVFAFVHSRYLP